MRRRLPGPSLLLAFSTLAAACGSPPASDAGSRDAGAPGSDAGLDTDAGSVDAGPPEADAGPGPLDNFRLVGMTEPSCTLRPSRCAALWPAGRVLRFESEETFEGATHPRTFYAVIPPDLTGPAPVWIQLHGGYGSFERQLTLHETARLAAGSPLDWTRNAGDCQLDPFADPAGFVDASGEPCDPEAVSARSAERAIVVYPEGVDQDGQRHWEDGRIPSPGFGTTAQNRDDLGFLDHVLRTLLDTPEVPLDAERVYLSGVSNGGNMTLRVICSVGDPRYPTLERIAAFSVVVSAMAEGSARGLEGRTACRASAPRPLPVHYIVGRGFPTPTPDVDGDGYVPWGVPGEVRRNNSPSGGWLLAVDDTLDLLRAHLEASSGAPSTERLEPLGAFATRRQIEVGGTVAQLVQITTEGGHHTALGARADFHPTGREWDFLSRYRLRDGQLSRSETSPMSGTW